MKRYIVVGNIDGDLDSYILFVLLEYCVRVIIKGINFNCDRWNQAKDPGR